MQEPINQMEAWFLENLEGTIFTESRIHGDKIEDALRGAKYPEESRDFTADVKKYFDLGIIIRLINPDDVHEWTEVKIGTRRDLSEPPNYYAKSYLCEELGIGNTFYLFLPKFDEGVVPTRSELFEMIEMVEEELNETQNCVRYWSD